MEPTQSACFLGLKKTDSVDYSSSHKKHLFLKSDRKPIERLDLPHTSSKSGTNSDQLPIIDNPNKGLMDIRLKKYPPHQISIKDLAITVEREMKELDIKKFRKITNRKTRRQVLRKYPTLLSLSKCNSKLSMVKIYETLSPKWKRLLRIYMSKSFILHLHIRQIRDFSLLFRQRHALYKAIDSPSVLMESINFSNNLVKNFCKGFTNFVVMFFEDISNNNLLPEPALPLVHSPSKIDSRIGFAHIVKRAQSEEA